LLLWIDRALTPQEVRDKIQSNDGPFIKSMLDYLNSVNKGEFNTGTKDEVAEKVRKAEQTSAYCDPTRTLPSPPPPLCTKCRSSECEKCKRIDEWWTAKYLEEIDDILLKSNVHVWCLNNKWKKCKSRFPREIFSESHVEPETGRINLKKLEAFLNTFTNILTYLVRCNTDVTSLHSGTAVKAVVAYVSDYITKCGLKTHTIFETIRNVYAR
ncbi:hypothetical protein CPC08DRAFT_613648, partial [Agrocybe pediades]